MSQFVAQSDFNCPVEDLFNYHARPGALDRLLPPWQAVSVVKRGLSLDVGTKVVLRLRTPIGIAVHWHAEHTRFEPPYMFEDIQTSGPMSHWRHQHLFHPLSPESSRLTDQIDFRLPGGTLGNWIGGKFLENDLQKMFRYRHSTTRDDIELTRQFPSRPLKVAVSGTSGLVGSNLVALLRVAGHSVIKLSRTPSLATNAGDHGGNTLELAWSPSTGLADPAAAEGLDAVIHLAGKGIGDQRWNAAVKKEIRNSRVAATEILAKQLACLASPPRVFISCSAIGYYGNRNDERLDESSSKGSGFLADVCEAWEQATAALHTSGKTRVVYPRLGIVLHPRQGALAKLLPPIRCGAGGRMGDGRQFWSWISIADCIGALYHLLMDQRAEGAFNLVAPEPERNADFIRKLAHLLHRPALFPAPKSALELLLGEMAGPLLFDSCRVVPEKLQRLGYRFRHPSLESALRYLLGL